MRIGRQILGRNDEKQIDLLQQQYPMTSNIQVAIAEDHPLSREGFVTICRRDARLEVIITASNGRELLKKMKEQRPDVVMMDMRMPEMNGLEATEHIKQHYPDIYKKLKVKTQMELIGYALSHRLIVTLDIFKDYFNSDNGFT